MEINIEEIAFIDRYKLLTGTVVPRPIALVSTMSPDGDCNLAPFSYFYIVGHNPMTLSFSIAGINQIGQIKTLSQILFQKIKASL